MNKSRVPRTNQMIIRVQRISRIGYWAVLGIYLVVGMSQHSSILLCISNDGHIMLESPVDHKHRHGSCQHTHHHQDEQKPDEIYPKHNCNDCVDIPIPWNVHYRQMSPGGKVIYQPQWESNRLLRGTVNSSFYSSSTLLLRDLKFKEKIRPPLEELSTISLLI